MAEPEGGAPQDGADETIVVEQAGSASGNPAAASPALSNATASPSPSMSDLTSEPSQGSDRDKELQQTTIVVEPSAAELSRFDGLYAAPLKVQLMEDALITLRNKAFPDDQELSDEDLRAKYDVQYHDDNSFSILSAEPTPYQDRVLHLLFPVAGQGARVIKTSAAVVFDVYGAEVTDPVYKEHTLATISQSAVIGGFDTSFFHTIYGGASNNAILPSVNPNLSDLVVRPDPKGKSRATFETHQQVISTGFATTVEPTVFSPKFELRLGIKSRLNFSDFADLDMRALTYEEGAPVVPTRQRVIATSEIEVMGSAIPVYVNLATLYYPSLQTHPGLMSLSQQFRENDGIMGIAEIPAALPAATQHQEHIKNARRKAINRQNLLVVRDSMNLIGTAMAMMQFAYPDRVLAEIVQNPASEAHFSTTLTRLSELSATQGWQAHKNDPEFTSQLQSTFQLLWAMYQQANPGQNYDAFLSDTTWQDNFTTVFTVLSTVIRSNYFQNQPDKQIAYENLANAVAGSITFTPSADRILARVESRYDAAKLTVQNMSTVAQDREFHKRVQVLLSSPKPAYMLSAFLLTRDGVEQLPNQPFQQTLVNFDARPQLKPAFLANIDFSHGENHRRLQLVGSTHEKISEAASTIAGDELRDYRAPHTITRHTIDKNTLSVSSEPLITTIQNEHQVVGDEKSAFLLEYLRYFLPAYSATMILANGPTGLSETGNITVNGITYYEQTLAIDNIQFLPPMAAGANVYVDTQNEEEEVQDPLLRGNISLRYKYSAENGFNTLTSLNITGTPRFIALCEIAAFFPNVKPTFTAPTLKEGLKALELQINSYRLANKLLELQGKKKVDYLNTPEHQATFEDVYTHIRAIEAQLSVLIEPENTTVSTKAKIAMNNVLDALTEKDVNLTILARRFTELERVYPARNFTPPNPLPLIIQRAFKIEYFQQYIYTVVTDFNKNLVSANEDTKAAAKAIQALLAKGVTPSFADIEAIEAKYPKLYDSKNLLGYSAFNMLLTDLKAFIDVQRRISKAHKPVAPIANPSTEPYALSAGSAGSEISAPSAGTGTPVLSAGSATSAQYPGSAGSNSSTSSTSSAASLYTERSLGNFRPMIRRGSSEVGFTISAKLQRDIGKEQAKLVQKIKSGLKKQSVSGNLEPRDNVLLAPIVQWLLLERTKADGLSLDKNNSQRLLFDGIRAYEVLNTLNLGHGLIQGLKTALGLPNDTTNAQTGTFNIIIDANFNSETPFFTADRLKPNPKPGVQHPIPHVNLLPRESAAWDLVQRAAADVGGKQLGYRLAGKDLDTVQALRDQLEKIQARLKLEGKKSSYSWYHNLRKDKLGDAWIAKLNLIQAVIRANEQGILYVTADDKLAIHADKGPITDVTQYMVTRGGITASSKPVDAAEFNTLYNSDMVRGQGRWSTVGLKDGTEIVLDNFVKALKARPEALQVDSADTSIRYHAKL